MNRMQVKKLFYYLSMIWIKEKDSVSLVKDMPECTAFYCEMFFLWRINSLADLCVDRWLCTVSMVPTCFFAPEIISDNESEVLLREWIDLCNQFIQDLKRRTSQKDMIAESYLLHACMNIYKINRNNELLLFTITCDMWTCMHKTKKRFIYDTAFTGELLLFLSGRLLCYRFLRRLDSTLCTFAFFHICCNQIADVRFNTALLF